jgi:hypothetical protein
MNDTLTRRGLFQKLASLGLGGVLGLGAGTGCNRPVCDEPGVC